MQTLWSLLIVFWKFLPWVAIAMMAALALHRRRESHPLLLQAVGASASFLVGMVQWVIEWILTATGASASVFRAEQIIINFLLFIGLSIFAFGYCVERFRRPAQNSPVQVSASPVDR